MTRIALLNQTELLPRAGRSHALLVLLILCSGCVANSDRAFRDRVVEPTDPWPTMWCDSEFGGTQGDVQADDAFGPEFSGPEFSGAEFKANDRLKGLQQLEDLVEGAASIVYGEDVDFPTPTIFDQEAVVFLYDRHAPSGQVTRFLAPNWLADEEALALKYLFDHIGGRSLARLSPSERSRILGLCQLVASYVEGDLTLGQAQAELAAQEVLALAPLELSEAQLVSNEERYDSSLWIRSGFTGPRGLFSRIRLNLAHEALQSGSLDAIFVYAHELHHALVFRVLEADSSAGKAALLRQGMVADGQGEELLALSELSAQVFAQRVVDQLEGKGLLRKLSSPVRESQRRKLSPAAALKRLHALYRTAPQETPSLDLIEARYGYSDQEQRLDLIEAAMESLGVRAYTALLPRLESFEELRAMP